MNVVAVDVGVGVGVVDVVGDGGVVAAAVVAGYDEFVFVIAFGETGSVVAFGIAFVPVIVFVIVVIVVVGAIAVIVEFVRFVMVGVTDGFAVALGSNTSTFGELVIGGVGCNDIDLVEIVVVNVVIDFVGFVIVGVARAVGTQTEGCAAAWHDGTYD